MYNKMMDDFETCNTFWEIVAENELRDVVVPIAAEDERLKRVTRWILTDDEYPDYSGAGDYDRVVDLVIGEYGLLPDQVDQVLNLCEDNICNELNYGNKA